MWAACTDRHKLYPQIALLPWTLVMTKDTETLGLVLQNESFNYQLYNNCMTDCWSYSENLLNKQQHNDEGGHTADILFYSYNQTQYQREPWGCSLASTMSSEPSERTLTGSSLDLFSLDAPINITKSESLSSSQLQEALHQKSGPSPLCPPYVHQQCLSSSADANDKLVINNIFDSLLSQLWQPAEAPPYCNQEQPRPVSSEPCTNPRPETHRNDFHFTLGAPQATRAKSAELPVVYLNKGQFYPVSLQASSASLPCGRVKTVVMLVFENNKSTDTQLDLWYQWHARQPTLKQRVIDMADYKGVFSGISQVEEVAFNALSVIWNPQDEAQFYIAINCLSTDFSSQKGVKGLPLNLQIDTYDFSTGTNRLIHRAACQVKIFSDKGAERKMKDEERRRNQRRGKNVTQSRNNADKTVVSSLVGSGSTLLKTQEDHVTCPVLFTPRTHVSTRHLCSPVSPTMLEDVKNDSLKRQFSEWVDRSTDSPPPCKQARGEEQARVMLFVRRESEEVFESVVLCSPTLKGLKQAISKRYGLHEDTIGKMYKKCKSGILVNMDDNIVEHYTNHLPFLIEISKALSGHLLVTLVEL